MFPKKNRLNLRENPLFFLHANKTKTPHLVIYWKKSRLSPTLAAVVVGKKVYAKAVERNSAKRKLRARIYPLLQQSQHLSLVFILLKRISSQKEMDEIGKEIETVFTNMKLMNTSLTPSN